MHAYLSIIIIIGIGKTGSGTLPVESQTECDLPSNLEDIQVNDKQAGEILHVLQKQSNPSDAVLLSQGNVPNS